MLLLAGACSTPAQDLAVTGTPPTSTTTAPPDFDEFVALSASIEAHHERVEFERAVRYVQAVEEAERIAAQEAEARRLAAAEEQRRREQAAAAAAQQAATEPAPVATGNVWYRLRACECPSGWFCNTGNGYYGGLQFDLPTWRSVGGTGYPHEHSPEEQIRRGQILQSKRGWSPWPECSRKLGLR